MIWQWIFETFICKNYKFIFYLPKSCFLGPIMQIWKLNLDILTYFYSFIFIFLNKSFVSIFVIRGHIDHPELYTILLFTFCTVDVASWLLSNYHVLTVELKCLIQNVIIIFLFWDVYCLGLLCNGIYWKISH